MVCRSNKYQILEAFLLHIYRHNRPPQSHSIEIISSSAITNIYTHLNKRVKVKHNIDTCSRNIYTNISKKDVSNY